MSETVIKVENLSKRYQLGTFGYGSLQHDLAALWARVRGKEDPNTKIGEVSRFDRHGEFWALKDVSFEVKQGDRLGILGRNGAGKSTLLKILSRVTSPSEGRVKIRGRVASLLEVGTGFNPELTGRENVYLNGAIMGMKRFEIRRKFDEIVEFSGIPQFIDTPVKRYSSGMKVKLAFAVAAHLDSEILIADEVLAVGDAEFQKKSLGKMEDISTKQGRTVLFVSHQLSAVTRLCTSALLMTHGHAKSQGSVQDVIAEYVGGPPEGELTWKAVSGEWTDSLFRPIGLAVSTERRYEDSRSIDDSLRCSDSLVVRIDFSITESHPQLTCGIALHDLLGSTLFWSYITDASSEPRPMLQPGDYSFETVIPPNLLNEGQYRIELIASIDRVRWIVEPLRQAPGVTFELKAGVGRSPLWVATRPGSLAPILPWRRAR